MQNIIKKEAPELAEAKNLETITTEKRILETDTKVKENNNVLGKKTRERLDALNIDVDARQDKQQGSRTGVKKVEKEEPKTPPWKIEGIQEFLKKPKPRQWLLDKWIPKTGLCFIAGESGVGKTFIALHIALTLANEFKNSCIGLNTATCPVIYINGEGYDELYYRIQGYCKVYGVAERFSAINSSVPLDTEEGFKFIADNIPANGALFVDTFSTSYEIDENVTAQTKPEMNKLHKLAREKNSLIAIVHHFGKDISKGMRGSKNLFDSSDSVILLTKKNDAIDVELRKNKSGKDHIHKDIKMKLIDLDYNETTYIVDEDVSTYTSNSSSDWNKTEPLEEQEPKKKPRVNYGSSLWAMNKIKAEYETSNKTFSTTALFDNFYHWMQIGNPDAKNKQDKPKTKKDYRINFDTIKSKCLTDGTLFNAGYGKFTFNPSLAKTDAEIEAEMKEMERPQEQSLETADGGKQDESARQD